MGEFYPPVWPIELYIWNVWSLNFDRSTWSSTIKTTMHTHRLVQKSLIFRSDFDPIFHVPASKSHTYLTINSSICFLHCLTKRPVERKLLSSQERRWNAAYFWIEGSTSDLLVLANSNACNKTSISQSGRVDTRRKLQTVERSKHKPFAEGYC